MKNKLRELVVNILSFESGVILRKFKPNIIAITGNVGKTTTKDFIAQALTGEDFRAAEKSQNSEFGVCLTILGQKNAWNSFSAWLNILTIGFLKTYLTNSLGKNNTYPKTLVLEVGADHPGDIKHITSFVKPNTVVLTAFQSTPTHREFFRNIEQHIREKKYLVDALVSGGNIVYNIDDEIMSSMSQAKKAKDSSINLFTFGKDLNADVCILESGNYYNSESEVLGTKVKLRIESEIIEIELIGVLGEAQNYALAASVLCAILQNVTLDKIKLNFQGNNFKPTNSRMRILKGKNNITIVDDSYNASPIAIENALSIFAKTFTKGRKVLVLGHMAELGDKTREAHLNAGNMAGEVADIIIFSGKSNEHYLDGIRQTKFPLEKVFLAKNAEEVNKIIHDNNLLKTDDLILVKGSQSARLEKVVVNLLMDKRDTQKVCRQDEEWIKR